MISNQVTTARDLTTYADLQGVEVLNLAAGSTAKVTVDAQMTSVIVGAAATVELNTNAQAVNADALADGVVLTLTDTATTSASVSLAGGDLAAGSYDGNLTVTATNGSNVITTGAGNDTITGGDGADTINVGVDAAADVVVFTAAEAGGADRVTNFTVANDIVRIDQVLNDGATAAAINTVDAVDEIVAADYTEAATIAALNGAGVGVYNFTTDIGAIDFTASTDAQILAAVEAALEDAVAGGGLLSGVAATQVTQGGIGTDVILAINDGANIALVRYQEGAASEADFAGELTLVGVLNGVAAAGLSDANFFA